MFGHVRKDALFEFCVITYENVNSKEILTFGAGKSMSSSNCNPEGCSIVGHGILAAFYVSWGGARGSRAATCLPEDGSNASSAGFGGR